MARADRRLIARPRRLLALAAAASLALAGCGQDPAAVEQDSGDEKLPDPGAAEQLTAPDPAGEQHSHDAMRKALRSVYGSATLTDTNDVLPGARDLETELKRLAVDPQECKQHVISSAAPIPDDALVAAAQVTGEGSGSSGGSGGSGGSGRSGSSGSAGLTSSREATVMSFLDVEAAQMRIDGEQEGVENCPSYTITRSEGEGEGEGESDGGVTTKATVEEQSVRTAAEQGFAVVRSVVGDGETTRSVNVMLRHGAQVVAVSAAVDGKLSSSKTEKAAETVRREAARVLSDVTGEDLSLKKDDESDGDDGGESGSGGSGGDSSEGSSGDGGG